jgi:CheY-like chemotaxis protein/HPt (histidine-containing phosphotransfer) domain-containing protein
VQDTGVGISAQAQQGLFSPFVQADSSVTRKYGGTGLGLAICKRLVNQMNGQITCESQPGVGSLFWFTVQLPLTKPPEAEPGSAAAGRPRAGSRPSDTRPASILVVEDNEVNQEVAVSLLASRGHHVQVAQNGLEALDAIERHEFDIVLMDCHMPVMDGYEATRQIRRRPGASGRVPIVAMTANALPQERDRCLTAGMNDYLAKPFRAKDLEAILGRWLTKAEPIPDPQEPGADPEPEAAARVFNRQEALALVEGKPQILERLIRTFLTHTPGRIEKLKAALEYGDTNAAMEWAHSLKGASAAVCAETMHAASLALEQVARDGDLAGARDRFGTLCSAYEALRDVLSNRESAAVSSPSEQSA